MQKDRAPSHRDLSPRNLLHLPLRTDPAVTPLVLTRARYYGVLDILPTYHRPSISGVLPIPLNIPP